MNALFRRSASFAAAPLASSQPRLRAPSSPAAQAHQPEKQSPIHQRLKRLHHHQISKMGQVETQSLHHEKKLEPVLPISGTIGLCFGDRNERFIGCDSRCVRFVERGNYDFGPFLISDLQTNMYQISKYICVTFSGSGVRPRDGFILAIKTWANEDPDITLNSIEQKIRNFPLLTKVKYWGKWASMSAIFIDGRPEAKEIILHLKCGREDGQLYIEIGKKYHMGVAAIGCGRKEALGFLGQTHLFLEERSTLKGLAYGALLVASLGQRDCGGWARIRYWSRGNWWFEERSLEDLRKIYTPDKTFPELLAFRDAEELIETHHEDILARKIPKELKCYCQKIK